MANKTNKITAFGQPLFFGAKCVTSHATFLYSKPALISDTAADILEQL